MPSARPVFHPEIGAELFNLRDAKGWSLPRAIIAARAKGHKKLTAQALRYLEEGRTRLPDASALRAIEDLYGLDYSALALRITRSNYERDLATYGRDLLRQGQDQGSVHPTTGGTADELPATARRISELEKRLTAYEAALSTVEDVAKRLVDLAAARAKGGLAHGSQARRRRRS